MREEFAKPPLATADGAARSCLDRLRELVLFIDRLYCTFSGLESAAELAFKEFPLRTDFIVL